MIAMPLPPDLLVMTSFFLLEAGTQLPWSGFFVSVVTMIAFNRVCRFLRTNPCISQPAAIRSDHYLSWRWTNVLTSLIHSLISGLWSIYCVLHQPSLVTDMILVTSRSAYFLVSFSHGYFVYDLMEMMMNIRYRGCLELSVHHVFVLTCLLISVLHCRYLGFACIALMVELSNIFLHSRTLMKIARVNSLIFSVHRWINLAFFVIFRLLVLLFLVSSMFQCQSLVPTGVFFAGIVCGTVVLLMSAALLYRLILSDFGPTAIEGSITPADAAAEKVKDQEKVESSESNGRRIATAAAAAGDQTSAASNDPILLLDGSDVHQQHSLSKKIS